MIMSKPYRSKKYLIHAKNQRGLCCVCKEKIGSELHHFGEKGMGQKGSDLLVCRVCQSCHQQIQGKRRLAFTRLKNQDTWIDIQADAIELLKSYIKRFDDKKDQADTDETQNERSVKTTFYEYIYPDHNPAGDCEHVKVDVKSKP